VSGAGAAARGTLVVFAKRPEPGRVKTRLCPPLTPDQAAALYAEMLADVLQATADACNELELAAVLSVDPPEAGPAMAALAPAAFRVVPQRGAGLAERMTHAVDMEGAAGARAILLRGSDSPALDLATLRAGLEGLADHDVVLCPDLDGGYGLVALARPAPGLFEHAMSTERVLDDTLAQARRLGLRVQLLEPRFDIDDIEDLARLRQARTPALERLCPRTLAHLDALELWP
jgi:rSAM/selenodomain-associated transferase 1